MIKIGESSLAILLKYHQEFKPRYALNRLKWLYFTNVFKSIPTTHLFWPFVKKICLLLVFFIILMAKKDRYALDHLKWPYFFKIFRGRIPPDPPTKILALRALGFGASRPKWYYHRRKIAPPPLGKILATRLTISMGRNPSTTRQPIVNSECTVPHLFFFF